MNSKNSKTSILRGYYSILQIKQTEGEEINLLFYQVLTFTIHVKI